MILTFNKVISDTMPMVSLFAKEKISKGFAQRCIKNEQCVIAEEMFMIVFSVFDKLWMKRNSNKNYSQSYMSFGFIMKEMERYIKDILSKNASDFGVFKFLIEF